MKNKIKTGVNKFVEHVENNKFGYAAGAFAIIVVAVNQHNLKRFYAFLEERDIDPMEFYWPELWEELNK